MSLTPAAPASVPAVPADQVIGLEDFDPAVDAIMPTLRIDHKKGVFVDALSGAEFENLNVVILGLIKQRVLWEAEVDDGNKTPLCRSYNFHEGHPDQKDFPWKESGFDKAAVEAAGPLVLPCESCALKDWGSHPNRDTPWCSEQHTFAVLQPLGDGLAPSLLTLQRSAIKPSRTYLTNFFRAKTPLYTVFTKIILDHRKRGQVDFAVPKLTQGEPTATEDWGMFAEQYLAIKEQVQTPRTFGDDAEEEEASGDPAAAPAPSAGVPVGATPPSADEDDLPF